MEIELVPDPGADDPAARAARRRLAREGLVDDAPAVRARRSAGAGPGCEDAVERERRRPDVRACGVGPLRPASAARYGRRQALPARSTRGATRA